MAFQLIGDKLPWYCDSLMKLPSSRYWLHETVVSTELGLPRGPAHGVSDVTTALLKAIRAGRWGSKMRNTLQSTGMDAVDLFDEMNASQISVQQCGQKEAFSRGHLKEEVVRRNPRWYLIGTPEERGINVQIET